MDKEKIKVLIIDDTSTHLLLLQSILIDEGYNADIVDDPKVVLKQLGEKEYQIVLLDIMMPGMDGFQVLDKIKSTEKLSKIPVIIISAKTDSWSIKTAMDKGAFDYITKPINVQDVKNKVQIAVNEFYKK